MKNKRKKLNERYRFLRKPDQILLFDEKIGFKKEFF